MLEFNNVSISVVNKNKNYKQRHLTILHKASGSIQAGRLTAIMGPSGGGKTTLMNCLAGRIPSGSITTGSVLVEGRPRNLSEWLRKCAYVDQDDQIFELLTVEETISYAARFRLQNTSEEYISSRVKQLMRLLCLTQVSKNQMKRLSGGQRKRTMIAIELIKDPQIIFLDEPTSGLDTNTANSLIRFLKTLAQQGKLVVLTVHQPSYQAFLCFDTLILVSKSKIVYNGIPSHIEQELREMKIHKAETSSLPDFVIEITNNNPDGTEQNLLYESAIQELIKSHQEKFNIIDKEIRAPSSRNVYYVQYRPNIQHIILLLKRRFTIDSKRAFVFILKSVIVPLVFLFGSIYLTISLDTKSPPKSILTDPLLLNIHPPYNQETENLLLNVLIFYWVSALISMMPASSAFYPESKLVRREIGVVAYSTCSYLVSIYLYQLFKNLLRNILAYAYLLYMVKAQHWWIFLFMYMTSPFLCVASGLFFGSITDHKKFSILIISMVGVIMTAFYIIERMDITTCGKGLKLMLKGTPLYIFHGTAFLACLFTPANLYLLIFCIQTRLNTFKTSWLFGIVLGKVTLWVVNIMTFVLLIAFSLILIGRTLRPSVRMDLSMTTK